MPLSPETLREIDGLVRGGFEERARIIEILCEEMYAPGELAAHRHHDCRGAQARGLHSTVERHVCSAHLRSQDRLEAPLTFHAN